jgi:hypothetical protein
VVVRPFLNIVLVLGIGRDEALHVSILIQYYSSGSSMFF